MKVFYTWTFIAAVVVFSSVGDVLLAKAMSLIGDLGAVRAKAGVVGLLRMIFRRGRSADLHRRSGCVLFSGRCPAGEGHVSDRRLGSGAGESWGRRIVTDDLSERPVCRSSSPQWLCSLQWAMSCWRRPCL